jgi:branched-chain amino acid transport system permease protein
VTLFAQFVLSGLGQGAIFALVALGIVVIYNATQIVNFAHGAMGTAAAYVAWFCADRLGMPTLAAAATALVLAFAFGIVLELLVVRRIRMATTLTQMIVTVGLAMLLVGAVGLAAGFDPKALNELVPLPSVSLGALIVRPRDAIDLALLVALVAAFLVVYRRSTIGLGMRAIASDAFAARLVGVPLDRVLAVAWGFGVALAAAAAVLAAPSATLTPTMMDTVAVYGFIAAVVGGFGTVTGAIAGGLTVGVADELCKAYLAPELSLSCVFVLLLVVLWIRPSGLFGRELARRV